MSRWRLHGRFWLAVGLFVLAPLTGEFLLGNQPITQLGSLVILAPVYGGAAILIREVARRAGRGWPTMLLLSAAYGLILEGLIDQMLFNPGYLGLPSFDEMARIPGLNISASMTQAALTLHTVWSMCVPIALMEAFDREPARPWLGRFGLGVTALLFIAGAIISAIFQAQTFHFMASFAQLAGTSVAVLALCVVAFTIKRPPEPATRKPAPSPWLIGMVSFVLSSAYWLESTLMPENSLLQWLGVAGWFVLVGAAAGLFLYWSQGRDWTDLHRLALAGGALLTYVWAGFAHGRYLAASTSVVITGNVIFGASAIVLLVLAVHAQRKKPA